MLIALLVVMVKVFSPSMKWMIALSFLLIAGIGVVTIAGNEASDPLLVKVQDLEALADSALLDPELNFESKKDKYVSGSIIGFLQSKLKGKQDGRVDISDPKFKELLSKIRGVKKEIEVQASFRSSSVLNSENEMVLAADADPKFKNSTIDKKLAEQKKKFINEKRAKIQDQVYSKFANVLLRYYGVQRRIFINQVKNAHYIDPKLVSTVEKMAVLPRNEELLNTDLYKDLNLKLNLEVGQYLFNHSSLKLSYNLWHVRNPHTHDFDQIELGLTPQDKSHIEQAVLEKNSDPWSYAKLIQLMATRARLVNQWAVDRMSTMSPADLSSVKLAGCGPGLVSFNDRSSLLSYSPGNYYDFLWKKDRYEEFAAQSNSTSYPIAGYVAAATLNRPLVQPEMVSDHLFKFFDQLGLKEKVAAAEALTAQVTTTPTPAAVSAEDTGAGSSSFYEELRKKLHQETAASSAQNGTAAIDPKAAYASYLPQQLLLNELDWQNLSGTATVDASMLEDRWDDESVAERTALQAYRFKRKFLVDLFFYQAQAQSLITDLSGYKKATEAVDAMLSPLEVKWKDELRLSILEVLKSPAVKKIRDQFKLTRLQNKYDELRPTLLSSAQAEYTLRKYNEVKELNTSNGAWKNSGKSLYNKTFETGYVASKPYLNQLLSPWSPEQLVKFYYAKVNFFVTKVDQDRSELFALASKLQNDQHLQLSLGNFFENLQKRFSDELTKRKIKPEELNPSNTPLYDVLLPAVTEAFNAYVTALDKKPELKDPGLKVKAPQNTLDAMKSVGDNTILTSQYRPKYDFGFYAPTVDKRKEAIDLFIQAMSILNLGEMLSTDNQGADTIFAAAVKKKNASAADFKKYSTLRNPTFLRMEIEVRTNSGFPKLINPYPHGSINKTVLRSRIFQSLLDQRILSESFINGATDLFPILDIQYGDSDDVESPTVLKNAVSKYTPSKGLNDTQGKFALVLGLKKASESTPGLVEEACKADPKFTNPNDLEHKNFANLYHGSRSLRALYSKANAEFAKYDENLRKYTRTKAEAIKEDYLDKIGQAIFFAFIAVGAIALLINLPVILSGLAGLLSGVGFAAGAEGVGALFGISGASLVIPGVSLASLGTLMNVMVIPGFFIFQLANQYQVSCYEMPSQLKYQFRAMSSQVGSEESITLLKRDDLRWMSSNVHTMQVSFAVNLGFQAAFMPTIWKMGKVAVGKFGTQVIDRVATAQAGIAELKLAEAKLLLPAEKAAAVEEATAASKALNEIKQKSLKQWVAEKGEKSGMVQFAKQQFTDFIRYGKVMSVNANVTIKDVWTALIPNFVEFYKNKETLIKALSTKMAELDAQAAKLWDEVAKSKLVREELNGELTFTEYGKSVIKNFILDSGMSGRLRALAVDPKVWAQLEQSALKVELIGEGTLEVKLVKDAFGKVLKKVNEQGITTSSDLRGMIHYLQLQELTASRIYYSDMVNALNGITKSGKYIEDLHNYTLAEFFKGMSTQELVQFRGFSAWAMKNEATGVVGAELSQFKQALKDFDYLLSEAALIEARRIAMNIEIVDPRNGANNISEVTYESNPDRYLEISKKIENFFNGELESRRTFFLKNRNNSSEKARNLIETYQKYIEDIKNELKLVGGAESYLEFCKQMKTESDYLIIKQNFERHGILDAVEETVKQESATSGKIMLMLPEHVE